MSRLKTPHRCLQCGIIFYPHGGGNRFYCGWECSRRANTELAQIAQRLRAARVPQPLPRDEWPEVVT